MAHRSRASMRSELTNAGQMIMGKPRWQWVEDGCRALIAATTGEGRWQIVREGFPKFQALAASAFRNFSPVPYTSSELREIFEGIVAYASRPQERRLHRAYEKMYDKRHRWDRDFAKRRDAQLVALREDEPGPTTSEHVKVEKIVDGSLRRVH